MNVNNPATDLLPTPANPMAALPEPRYASPSQEDLEKELGPVIDDFQVGWRMIERGELDEYSGQHVVIVEGRVVGAGKNWGEACERASHECGVPMSRLAVVFVDDGRRL